MKQEANIDRNPPDEVMGYRAGMLPAVLGNWEKARCFGMNKDAVGSLFGIEGLRIRASVCVCEDGAENGETDAEGAEEFIGGGSVDSCDSPPGMPVESVVGGSLVAPALSVQIMGDGLALAALGSTRYVFPCTTGGRMRVVYRAVRDLTSFFAFWNSVLG